jgi:hypothetical protein
VRDDQSGKPVRRAGFAYVAVILPDGEGKVNHQSVVRLNGVSNGET